MVQAAGACFNCGKTGHRAAECWSKKKGGKGSKGSGKSGSKQKHVAGFEDADYEAGDQEEQPEAEVGMFELGAFTHRRADPGPHGRLAVKLDGSPRSGCSVVLATHTAGVSVDGYTLTLAANPWNIVRTESPRKTQAGFGSTLIRGLLRLPFQWIGKTASPLRKEPR